MNNLPQVFEFKGLQVRTVIQNNEPWFVASDVCRVLEIGNTSDAVRRLDDDEKGIVSIDTLGGQQNMVGVNEPGLYELILGSRKKEAKDFKRWIKHEVLPQIRKTGSYGVATQYHIPKTYAEALRLSADLSEKNEKLEAKIEADRPKVLFAESLQVSNDSILIGELAKVLRQNGINVGQNRLFQILRRDGYLIKSGEQYNMPTQRSMDLKIMEIKTGSRSGSDGTIKITRTPKITGKGQIYFINKFKSSAAIAN